MDKDRKIMLVGKKGKIEHVNADKWTAYRYDTKMFEPFTSDQLAQYIKELEIESTHNGHMRLKH